MKGAFADMLKILFVASEAVPFVKTGGLADVAGSLPKELAKNKSIDIRVVLPKYSAIPREFRDNMQHIYDGEISVAWRRKFLGVDLYEVNNVKYYFVDNEEYFSRGTLYGHFDDAERFSFFAKAVLEMLPKIDFMPDVIHVNDWHTALLPIYLKTQFADREGYDKIKTVFTIHNLKYQGIFGKDIMNDVLGIDWQYFDNGDLEFYGAVNFMKSGILYADKITTVSPTYAEEIQTEYFGEGLDGVLRANKQKLIGILNGIDIGNYNPRTDEALAKRFGKKHLRFRSDNKVALQEKLHLPIKRTAPMVAMVTRLVQAKGIDLVIRILDEALAQEEDMQFVLLGSGDKYFEDWFKELAFHRRANQVSVTTGFDEKLSRQIYAAADIFLMPSMYEPCGLSQMIAMRYGAVPIVRATGGLQDSVERYNKETQVGNGFVFDNYNAHELLFELQKAVALNRDVASWMQLVYNAMATDFSWKKSADTYKKMYQSL